MLRDIVIDTNVLMHADDPRQSRQPAAVDLIEGVLTGKTCLAVDPGFELEEGKNRSHIGSEYHHHLTPLSLGFHLLVELASTERLIEVSRSTDSAISRKVNQLIRNKRDRTFIRVAYNSKEKTLCSHDYVDLQKRKRKELTKAVGVSVCEAADAVARL